MKIQKFNSFIKESDEQEADPLSPEGSRLRELGLAPDLEWDERFDLMFTEWIQDPEVNKAVDILDKKIAAFLEKYKTDEDDEYGSDFQQWTEHVAENGISDISLLDFLIINY